jgi:hypothetical protein
MVRIRKAGKLIDIGTGTRGMAAKATKLPAGKGLKIPGNVTGMHSGIDDEMDTISIDVGGPANKQRLNIKVPKGLAMGLVCKKVDIILAFSDRDEDDI